MKKTLFKTLLVFVCMGLVASLFVGCSEKKTVLNIYNVGDYIDMEVIDMRRELREGNDNMFSKRMLQELDDTIKSGNQAMIFINRRGFAS